MIRRHRDLALAVLGLACLLVTTGCAEIKPWERDVLARDDMKWDPDPLERALEAHIQFSKEAAMPGGGAGGGGCGCN